MTRARTHWSMTHQRGAKVTMHRWPRPIEVTVAIVTTIAAGLAALTWIVVASIPDFVAAAEHPNYVSPFVYLIVFGAMALVFGGIVGLLDALLFWCLRCAASAARLGTWASYGAAAVASIAAVGGAYASLGLGAAGPNPVVFIGTFSTISFAGFVVWIVATGRVLRRRDRLSSFELSGDGDIDELFDRHTDQGV